MNLLNIRSSLRFNIDKPKMEKKFSSISKLLTANPLLATSCVIGIESENLHQFFSKRIIYEAIQNNKITKHFNTEMVQKIVSLMYQMEYTAGSVIMGKKQNQSNMIIVENGKFEAKERRSNGETKGVIGKIYGEEELLMSTRKVHEITAITKCKVWILNRKDFKTITKSNGKNAKDLDILRNFSWFKNVDIEVLSEIADAIKIEYFGSHETLKIRDNTLYIISNGCLKLLPKGADQTKAKILRVLRRGDHFEGNTESNYKMIAFSPGAELLTIDIDILNRLIGMSEYLTQEVVAWSSNKSATTILDSYKDIKLEDLETLSTLGRGGFGRVDLVRYSKDPKNPKLFALKLLEKQRTVTIHQQSHVIDEREILLSLNHPFIVRLYKTFRDEKYVYLLTEACLGGQLWEVLYKKGFFDKETARFVAATAVEALDYLHRKQIINRDLKPDNMVIDLDGYVKLVDFGFSKHLGFTGRTWTFCGTPGNIAPEMILNEGHDRAVDLWALGMLVYELLCGCTIFEFTYSVEVYEHIMAGVENASFSYHINGTQAEDLVRRLCKREPNERLGYRTIEDVKAHRWFKDFDWNGLVSRTMVPPKCLIPIRPIDVANMIRPKVNLTLNFVPPKEESNWDQVFE